MAMTAIQSELSQHMQHVHPAPFLSVLSHFVEMGESHIKETTTIPMAMTIISEGQQGHPNIDAPSMKTGRYIFP